MWEVFIVLFIILSTWLRKLQKKTRIKIVRGYLEVLALKVLMATAEDDNLISFLYFSDKIRLDVSCEPSYDR